MRYHMIEVESRVHHVDRRQFLKSAVEMAAGSALYIGGAKDVIDYIAGSSKVEELRVKARREAAVKIPPPDKEALENTQKIEEFRYAKGLLNMSDDERNQYGQALKIFDQQKNFEISVKKLAKQKIAEEDRSLLRTPIADVAAMFGGTLLLARGLPDLVIARNRG